MQLVPLHQNHYRELHAISLRAEKLPCEFAEFSGCLEQRTGWTVMNGAKVIGCITFSDYVQDHDIVIHCFIDPSAWGRWALRREFGRQVFDYCFEEMNCQRVTGYSITGVSDKAATFLEALGFKEEGVLRQKAKLKGGGVHDLKIYGLLKHERRW